MLDDHPDAVDPSPGNEAEAAVSMMLAADRASAALGIEVIDHRPGFARARMTVRPDMINGHDLAHGGLIFALADTAFACACNGWGAATVAAGAEITFLQPARQGDLLEAEAEVRARSGRVGVYDVTVRRAGEVIALFRGRSTELRGRVG